MHVELRLDEIHLDYVLRNVEPSEELITSIYKHGLLNCLAVYKDVNGKYQLLDGGSRLKALKELHKRGLGLPSCVFQVAERI